MAVAAVKICLKKKGKARQPSELEKILLGYYIRLGPGSQESHVYLRTKWLRHDKWIDKNFGIKLFLSQNWGHVFTPKIGEERGNSKLLELCRSRTRLHEGPMSADSEEALELALFE